MLTTAVLIDANGYLSLVLNLLGNVLLAWKWRSGWFVRILAIISWGTFGWQTSSNPIMLNAGVFLIVNIYGWRKWGEEAKQARWFEEQRRTA